VAITETNAAASTGKPIAQWRDEIRDAIGRSELLEAFDLAERALEQFPDDTVLRWSAVLALARAGATRQARIRYDRFKLGDLITDQPADTFLTDVAALDARIAKDEALHEIGRERNRLLAIAAARYQAIFRRAGGYYPGINAATLTLLCGDLPKAESLAREVLKSLADNREDYYALATEAEAALIIGDLDTARTALRAASIATGRDFSAIASTRHQLRLVCDARGISQSILEPLTPPNVIHYSGHMTGPRFPESAEATVRNRIATILDKNRVGFGYGSLAAGADIIFAEELLSRGAELNVAMPFDIEEFKRVSVAPGGKRWLARFDECVRSAKNITYATTDEYLGDDSLFGYASRIAMGLAMLRSRFLDASLRQVAVWDGGAAGGAEPTAGAAADVSFWRARGLPGDVIDPRDDIAQSPVRKRLPRRPVKKKARAKGGRAIRAMLFGDVKGFSTLREAQLPIFAREMLGRFARVLDRHGRGILFRNTWGDGLYVVTKDVETAAKCATELQDEMATFVPTKHGLPEYMALRLGGHLGPVFHLRDPVLKRPNFIGAHVSRAARIEPVTPEGAVYVTEAFAAVLAASGLSQFVCEYVGQVPAAKHYGTMRMYSLRRIGGSRTGKQRSPAGSKVN
jgi:class 3 adenylate cyclase/tetratricopeptide (TPR) repeat protein